MRTRGANHRDDDDLEHVVIHGYRRAYRRRGSGPALLLIHGLGCDSSTWSPVMDQLAEHFTVIAPDLLGHGDSDKPDADYSIGGYANGMRDLLTVLDIDTVTVVGHSLGGGVAMQFAYQFPERTERVVLIATGGLGRDVSPLIRLLTLPGAGMALGVATMRPWRAPVAGGLKALSALPVPALRDLGEVADIYVKIADPAQRKALRRASSTVMDWRGQFVTMADRAYLARLMPVLIVWGTADMVVPVDHAHNTPDFSNCQTHLFHGAGHFPHREQPERFVDLVVRFCADKAPATYHRGRWRALLRRGDQFGLDAVPQETAGAVS